MSCVMSVGGICSSDDRLKSVCPRAYRHHQMPNMLDMGDSFLYLRFLIRFNAAASSFNVSGAAVLMRQLRDYIDISNDYSRISGLSYSWGPALTRALPAGLEVYFTKFLLNLEARSLAFSSHSAASA